MFKRSPGPVSASKVASASLATGKDSPVSRASSVSKLTASSSLVVSVRPRYTLFRALYN